LDDILWLASPARPQLAQRFSACCGEIYTLYKKWFQSPIPLRGTNLNVPMNFLLRDSLKAPSDRLFN
jgi:hypothetical protein